MFINCREFTSPASLLKVYNTNPFIVYSMDIFFICEDPDIYASILTPDDNGDAKIKIVIDNVQYPLTFGEEGESPLNPIRYVKPIEKSRVTFHKPNSIEKITGFVGPDVLTDAGTNIDGLDDYVQIQLHVDNLFGLSSKIDGYGVVEYGIDGYGGYRNTYSNLPGIIVTEVSQDRGYDYLYKDTEHYASQTSGGISTGIFGFGESSFGGVLDDGNVEGFGGA